MAEFRIDADPGEDAVAGIQKGLSEFNRRTIGDQPLAGPLNLAAYDESGKLRGGITGRVFLDALYFDLVWIDDEARGSGLGRALITRAEEDGKARGARYAWLNTLSWQARPFYEHLGYRVFGELPVLNGQHRRHFMVKDL
jgi:GNAT superfamily N-acetyltransferase